MNFIRGIAMESAEGLSGKDIKLLVIENLKDAGVDPELVEVIVKTGSKIVLRGEIFSESEGSLIMQTVLDIIGINNVVNEMEVVEGASDYNESSDEGLRDEDNEAYGTEDMFKAVEDGMPYIPPMSSSFDWDSKRVRKKRTRRESDLYW